MSGAPCPALPLLPTASSGPSPLGGGSNREPSEASSELLAVRVAWSACTDPGRGRAAPLLAQPHSQPGVATLATPDGRGNVATPSLWVVTWRCAAGHEYGTYEKLACTDGGVVKLLPGRGRHADVKARECGRCQEESQQALFSKARQAYGHRPSVPAPTPTSAAAQHRSKQQRGANWQKSQWRCGGPALRGGGVDVVMAQPESNNNPLGWLWTRLAKEVEPDPALLREPIVKSEREWLAEDVAWMKEYERKQASGEKIGSYERMKAERITESNKRLVERLNAIADGTYEIPLPKSKRWEYDGDDDVDMWGLATKLTAEEIR